METNQVLRASLVLQRQPQKPLLQHKSDCEKKKRQPFFKVKKYMVDAWKWQEKTTNNAPELSELSELSERKSLFSYGQKT